MSSLVVGYDGSGCARAALDAAIELARLTGDEVVIVFGYEPGGYGEEHATHTNEVRRFGERVTEGVVERAQRAGVSATLELLPQRPTDALISVADARDARAIVVGSFGESPLRGAILGSTPHKLLHLSTRPVFVVPVAREGE